MTKAFSTPTISAPQRTNFIIPSFTLSVPTWAGASSLLGIYDVGNTDYKFSLKLPIAEFGTAFVPALRYVEDGVVYRFKLWEAGVLYFPVYNGEKIGYNAKLEIWSINSSSAPDLESDKSLPSSLLTLPSNCNCNPVVNSQILLTESALPDPIAPDTYCNPFCENLYTLCNS